ncbi:GNAT family N-acetyltransferase [Agrococcus terreus]|uniref:GNAT family N-acetyltransferase n=1 Tax=Agrococcus terreus TaxID=574649 RepID=UPI00384E9287
MRAALRHVAPADAGAVLEPVLAVYAAAFAADGWQLEPGAIDAARSRIPIHLARPGASLVVAEADGALVGFAYGHRGERGQWWTDRMLAAAPALEPLLGGHFEVVELAVAPDAWGEGIGAALLEAVLAERPEPHALCTTRAGTRAMGMYVRRGWSVVAEPPGGQPVLHLPLAPRP